MKIGKRHPKRLLKKIWKELENSKGMTTTTLKAAVGEPVGTALDYTYRRGDSPLKRTKGKAGWIWSITGPLPTQTSGPSTRGAKKPVIELATEANTAVDAITALVAENQRLHGLLLSLKKTLEDIT